MVLAKNDSIEEIKDLPKWKKIKETGANIVLKRFIENDEVVTKQELIKIWDVKPRTVERYVKQGMPLHKFSTSRFQIFSIQQAEKWRDGSIDKTQSVKTEGLKRLTQNADIETQSESKNDVITKTDIERKLKADADKAEEDAITARLKRELMEGGVVDADDLDKAMAEQAIIHKTDKTNDEKILPVLLENKSSSEIAEILHEHNQERLNGLDKLINKEFKSKESLYDIVEVILQELKDGAEPESIIKRIKGSLI